MMDLPARPASAAAAGSFRRERLRRVGRGHRLRRGRRRLRRRGTKKSAGASVTAAARAGASHSAATAAALFAALCSATAAALELFAVRRRRLSSGECDRNPSARGVSAVCVGEVPARGGNPSARDASAVCVGEVPARSGISVGGRCIGGLRRGDPGAGRKSVSARCVGGLRPRLPVGVSAQLHRRKSRVGLALIATVGGRPRRMEGIC
jgi:hypothetical protein